MVRPHLQPIQEEDNSTIEGATYQPIPMDIGVPVGPQSGVASTGRRSQSGRVRSGASQSRPAYYCNPDGIASMDVDQQSYYTNDSYSYDGQHVTTLREDPYSRNHTSSGQSQGSKSRSQSHVGHGAMTTLREDPYSRNHTSSGQSQGSKSRSQSHVGHGARSRDNYSSSQSQRLSCAPYVKVIA